MKYIFCIFIKAVDRCMFRFNNAVCFVLQYISNYLRFYLIDDTFTYSKTLFIYWSITETEEKQQCFPFMSNSMYCIA